MKIIVIISTLIFSIWISAQAQAPVVEIDGFLEVSPGEISSLYIGFLAGQKSTQGVNTFVGSQTGQNNISGGQNCFFGNAAAFSNISGGQNSFFGTSAGEQNTSGSQNSFFGSNTGSGVTTQSQIIAIGFNAGPQSLGTDENQRLYIDVERTNTPLIFGDFDKDEVTINGNQITISDDQSPALRFERSGSGRFDYEMTLDAGDLIFQGAADGTGAQLDTLVRFGANGNITASGAINGSSDVNRKESFISIDRESILDKIAVLPITEWQYKTSPDRHIGPMAQDFYVAFGLGQGETTIATVDADGVALAAIQALNEKLESKISQLEKALEDQKQEKAQLEKRLVIIEVLLLKK